MQFCRGTSTALEKIWRSVIGRLLVHVLRQVAKDQALYALADILRGQGFTLEQVGLPCLPSEV